MKYSIIIPLKDEEDNIRALVDEIEPVMQGLQTPWELLCVDDGSTDQTPAILKELEKNKPYLRTLTFDRNYGQSSAFDAGFRHAKGEFIISLDGDRQNDPRDIPDLLKKAADHDLVCGKRINRKDPFLKKIVSRFANTIRRKICHDGVSDTGCSLKVYRAESLKKIKMYQGMHRFLPALFKIEGFRVTEVPVQHRPRTEGTTKYTFLNRYLSLFDLIAVRWMSSRQLSYKIKEPSHDS